jgi:two-component system, cell cycle response regulator DivK
VGASKVQNKNQISATFPIRLLTYLSDQPSGQTALSVLDKRKLNRRQTEMTVKATPIILIVDDYSDNRALLSAWLRAKGYAVVEAEDGREGLLQANRAKPDLILMDLAMPEMDGIEATRQIRQRNIFSRTPIFAISAYATHDVKADALAAGCAEFFNKPLDLDSLLGKIQSTLEQGNSGMTIRQAAGAR